MVTGAMTKHIAHYKIYVYTLGYIQQPCNVLRPFNAALTRLRQGGLISLRLRRHKRICDMEVPSSKHLLALPPQQTCK